MSTADAATRQQLLIHQFLTGMPTEVSKRLRASGEIDDLSQLIQSAKLLLTINAKEKPEEKSGAPASQPDSWYVSGVINRVMYSEIVRSQDDATCVEE